MIFLFAAQVRLESKGTFKGFVDLELLLISRDGARPPQVVPIALRLVTVLTCRYSLIEQCTDLVLSNLYMSIEVQSCCLFYTMAYSFVSGRLLLV
jgi:hypothetical protein